jgi:hypothetical protein
MPKLYLKPGQAASFEKAIFTDHVNLTNLSFRSGMDNEAQSG